MLPKRKTPVKGGVTDLGRAKVVPQELAPRELYRKKNKVGILGSGPGWKKDGNGKGKTRWPSKDGTWGKGKGLGVGD